MDDALLYRLWLAAVLGPANENAAALLSLYGSARAVWQARDSEDFSPLLRPAALQKLHSLRPEQFEPLARRCEEQNIRVLSWEEADYPIAFTHIPDPPAVLFCTGRAEVLNGQVYVGMVGSRRPTQYGAQVCAALGQSFAAAGAVIVSGLADGLDGEAHRAALAAGAPTVGILGTPIDHTYPAGNRTLRRQMEENGCVLSEYPPGEEGGNAKFRFLQRNRLIAALSDALCVVEARVKSGTANTVEHAERYGTPVYAVPGSIFSALSQGTNRLIASGRATLLAGADDLLDALGLQAAAPSAALQAAPRLGAAAQKLAVCLSPQSKGLEQLCTESGLTAAEALGALTELELAGLAVPLAGRQYRAAQ